MTGKPTCKSCNAEWPDHRSTCPVVTQHEQLTDLLRQLEAQYETMRARHTELENFTHEKLMNGFAMVANLKQQAAIARELGI